MKGPNIGPREGSSNELLFSVVLVVVVVVVVVVNCFVEEDDFDEDLEEPSMAKWTFLFDSSACFFSSRFFRFLSFLSFLSCSCSCFSFIFFL